ncbi:hypothetical protein MRB53_007998 [Persea americana]|uniref:Uncharacterized protein n=1 Tax=Persea americana TaxID=3435 RepID=A0ACC2MLI9_PERAE|nr:hypothetical protein MRB53_007998 [Persea americana]
MEKKMGLLRISGQGGRDHLARSIVSGETLLSSGDFALPPSLALSISSFSPNSPPLYILRSTWATKSSSRDWHPLSRDQRRMTPIIVSLLRLQHTIVLVYPASNPISSQRPSLQDSMDCNNWTKKAVGMDFNVSVVLYQVF